MSDSLVGASAQQVLPSALYPGSFDPPHHGHLDVIRRAAALSERLLVAVALNPDKQPFLRVEQRVELLTRLCADLTNVTVTSYSDSTLAFARANRCTVLVRGLRSAGDWEHETAMATIHREHGIDTVFLLTRPEHSHLSSAAVRLAVKAGLGCRGMVTEAVRAAVERQR